MEKGKQIPPNRMRICGRRQCRGGKPPRRDCVIGYDIDFTLPNSSDIRWLITAKSTGLSQLTRRLVGLQSEVLRELILDIRRPVHREKLTVW